MACFLKEIYFGQLLQVHDIGYLQILFKKFY